MKLKSIVIKNFRGYKDNTKVEFGNLTTFIGKNDVGKSTILEALDIFFNDGKGSSKIDKEDVNKQCRKDGNLETIIAISFVNLPNEVDIDSGNKTTLQAEYLLNNNNEFEIIKKYKDGGKAKVYIKAKHPTNSECCDLWKKKNGDLKKIIDNLKLDCDKTKNASMRVAIWNHYKDNLDLKEIELDVEQKEGDIKNIWGNIQKYLPVYSLFKSDRSNSDEDVEIQDPLTIAVKQILKSTELFEKLNSISEQVINGLKQVSNRTLTKIKEMNPEIAETLQPKFPEQLKWESVFKDVSITGDNNIPINKRGSGVKRLILLNFFIAEAENKKNTNTSQNIIYAIEEPETSQHIEHQNKMIKALKTLSLTETNNTQIILTTHSSNIVKQLDFNDLRMIIKSNDTTEIKNIEKKLLNYPSLNEVNYFAFNESSIEFHDELYGYLQSKAIDENNDNYRQDSFDNWLSKDICSKNKTWIKINKDGKTTNETVTLQTYIRNFVHHPENKENKPYAPEEFKQSIEEMIKFIRTLNNANTTEN